MLTLTLVNFSVIFPTLGFLFGTIFWIVTRMGSDIKPIEDMALFCETTEKLIVIDRIGSLWAAGIALSTVVGAGLLTMVALASAFIFEGPIFEQYNFRPAVVILAAIVLISWHYHSRFKKESQKLEIAFYRHSNPKIFL